MNMDDIEQELTPDVVAARCTEHEYMGRKLNPLTKARQAAAVSMGVKCFLGGIERDENGTYPEMFMDAIKLVWLCFVDNTTARRACFEPKSARLHALDWWEAHGGDIGSERFTGLLTVFGEMLLDLQTVSAEVDSSGNSSGSESLGESLAQTPSM
jgi:hypothetical protein